MFPSDVMKSVSGDVVCLPFPDERVVLEQVFFLGIVEI